MRLRYSKATKAVFNDITKVVEYHFPESEYGVLDLLHFFDGLPIDWDDEAKWIVEKYPESHHVA